MHVAVIGATGIVGRYLVPRLVEHGHEVVAVARPSDGLRRLAAQGVRVRVADILSLDALLNALSGCDAAVHVATAQ